MFLFSIERKEPSRILFVHEARNARGLQFYRTAIESTADIGFAVDAVTSDQAANVSPDKYCLRRAVRRCFACRRRSKGARRLRQAWWRRVRAAGVSYGGARPDSRLRRSDP